MRILPPLVALPVARGVALFFGIFTLLNILSSWRNPGFNANRWWIDVGFLPTFAGHTGLLLASLGLLSFGIGFPRHTLVRTSIAAAAAALGAASSWNVLSFYGGWLVGHIHPGMPVPLSLVLVFVLSFLVRATFFPWALAAIWQKTVFLMTFCSCFILFPLAQIYCFGETDYRRNADAIVVFGARVMADGTPSQALTDRTKTAIQLYKEHRAPILIFSGGPGDGQVSEPQAMRNLALEQGVPDSAIILDEQGLNTDLTVAHTIKILQDRHMKTALAVSNAYHLPRIKLAFSRAIPGTGIADVYTVPAHEDQPLSARSFFIAREIVALWDYYLRPLWRG